MKTIKDYLKVNDTQSYISLINTIIANIYDDEWGERIFDLRNSDDLKDFVELYGRQNVSRLRAKKPNESYNAHRYFLGGDKYYVDEKNRSVNRWRVYSVRELTEADIEQLLYDDYLHDWEEYLKDSLHAASPETCEEIVDGWNDYYKDYIDVTDYYHEVLKRKIDIINGNN